MEFRLLGTLEVRAGDGPVTLGQPKQRALLALLLLRANRVVARERLIDELWGEHPPETAVKSVQIYVSQLRKLLPAGMLLTRAPGYLLEVDPDAVDLLRFERLVASARGAEPSRASDLLAQALGLWRGPPLAEFAGEPFGRVEAGRLEELRLAALEERIDTDLALGRHSELAGELEALVAGHPHRERLCGQLMLALYRSGRQAEALGAYRDVRAALDELGLEPGAVLRQLEKQILNQDSALRVSGERLLAAAGATPLPGPLVPASPFPFVGRTRELSALRSLVDRAESGEGSLVLLAGEAGSGKTRLVRELAHEAAARGVLVCYGTSDAAVSTPYQPLREWLTFLLRVCEPELLGDCLGGEGQQLWRLVPELTRLAGTSAASVVDVEADRYLLQNAVAELAIRLSRLQPLLLVADDLHWADAETLHLLRRLARTAPEGRLLVLAAFRDRGEGVGPALTDALADFARIEGATRLALRNFTEADVSEFIRAAEDAEASAELVSAIGELTNGTPLVLCELWRDLRESGAIQVSELVELARPVAELRGAEGFHDILRQRLSRLADETGAVLELAAVAGPTFELRVLAGAGVVDADGLGAAVEQAVHSGFVELLPEPVPAYRFTHELVRRAVYDRVTGIHRAQLHLRVGDALERLHAADPAPVLPELAHHFTLAAPVAGAERGVDYNLRAADAAVAAAAFDEAAERLSTALELGIDEPRERARAQVELGYLLNETGRVPEGRAMLAMSLDAATGLEERGIAARALVQRMRSRLADSELDLEEMRTVLEAAIETLMEVGDSRGVAEAGRELGIALTRLGRAAEGGAALERALAAAETSGDAATRRMVAGTLANTLCVGPSPVPEVTRRCEELLESARGDRVLEATITMFLSLLLAMAGRFEEARDHDRRSSAVLDGLDQISLWVYRWASAESRELTGDRAGAEERFRARWLRYQEFGGPKIDERAMGAAYQLAMLYCDAGRWDDAEACLAYGREIPLAARTGTAIRRLVGESRLALDRGLSEEALALAQRGVELADATDVPMLRARAWLALAEARRAAGATAEADAALAQTLRLCEQKGNVAAAAAIQTSAAT